MSQQRRALVVRGGWDGHAPEEAVDLFVPFLREHDFDVVVEGSLEVYADAPLMASTDLIVQCWTMGDVLADELHGLRDAVAAGTGFAGWHGGIIDSFRIATDYLHFVGAQFAAHPGGIVDHTVTVVPGRADDPIVEGILGVRAALRAVLAARRRPERRARDHDHHARARRPVARAGHLTGGLEASVGRRPHLRLRARAPPGRPRAAARPHDHRTWPALGGPVRRDRAARRTRLGALAVRVPVGGLEPEAPVRAPPRPCCAPRPARTPVALRDPELRAGGAAGVSSHIGAQAASDAGRGSPTSSASSGSDAAPAESMRRPAGRCGAGPADLDAHQVVGVWEVIGGGRGCRSSCCPRLQRGGGRRPSAPLLGPTRDDGDRGGLGLVLGAVVGQLLAVSHAAVPARRRTVYPLVTLHQTVPTIVLARLLVWGRARAAPRCCWWHHAFFPGPVTSVSAMADDDGRRGHRSAGWAGDLGARLLVRAAAVPGASAGCGSRRRTSSARPRPRTPAGTAGSARSSGAPRVLRRRPILVPSSSSPS